MKEYNLKFTQLSRYILEMVVDPRSKIRKFIFVVLDLVKQEYRTTILIRDMNISMLMTNDLWINKEKLKERERENKSAKTYNFEYDQQMSSGWSCSFFQQKSSTHPGLSMIIRV